LSIKKIRTAIVGCGKIGLTHARALKYLPESEFVAVCSQSENHANVFQKEFEVNAYTDYKKMIINEGVEMISICTPHPLHARFITQAAELGVHVLTEKPLASDLTDCDKAINSCNVNKVKLGMISQRRLYPPILRMREAIQEGRIGKPIIGFMIVLGWRSKEYYEMDGWRGKWQSEGGGVMVNQTIHQLDLLQWLMGPVDELCGYWDNFNHPTIEVDDTAVAIMRFRNGAVGQFLVSNSQKPGFYGKIHIHGSSGASIGAQVEGGSPFIAGVTSHVDPPLNDMWTIPGEEKLLSQWIEEDRLFANQHDIMTYFHHLQIEDFIKSILEDRVPMVTGEEARKSVEILTAVYRSQRDHIPIKFPLTAETDRPDYDGRLSYSPFSLRRRKE
jgi:UDP-N-acetyl-2-amino-2-deoxyglucuronate dehydrogenase